MFALRLQSRALIRFADGREKISPAHSSSLKANTWKLKRALKGKVIFSCLIMKGESRPAAYHGTKDSGGDRVVLVVRVELVRSLRASSTFSYDLIPLKGELHPSVWPRAHNANPTAQTARMKRGGGGGPPPARSTDLVLQAAAFNVFGAVFIIHKMRPSLLRRNFFSSPAICCVIKIKN